MRRGQRIVLDPSHSRGQVGHHKDRDNNGHDAGETHLVSKYVLRVKCLFRKRVIRSGHLGCIGNSARPGESYGVEEARHLKCNRGIQSRHFSCDSYEGQHWKKITSPSGCGQMRLHWPASRRIPHASRCISETCLAGRIQIC
jgi:hypothetical protein